MTYMQIDSRVIRSPAFRQMTVFTTFKIWRRQNMYNLFPYFHLLLTIPAFYLLSFFLCFSSFSATCLHFIILRLLHVSYSSLSFPTISPFSSLPSFNSVTFILRFQLFLHLHLCLSFPVSLITFFFFFSAFPSFISPLSISAYFLHSLFPSFSLHILLYVLFLIPYLSHSFSTSSTRNASFIFHFLFSFCSLLPIFNSSSSSRTICFPSCFVFSSL
jgi:hypothetical protein